MPLGNAGVAVRRPRRRLRVPDREVRRRHQQEGRRVLHAAQRRAADGRHPRPARRARPSTTRPAAPAACCSGRSSTSREPAATSRTLFGKLYGQEKNLTTSAIARMNLVLHGIEDFQIVRGDTLRSPAFSDGDRPRHLRLRDRQSAVLAQGVGRGPLGQRPAGAATSPACRRASSGDYAWVQHMVASMAPTTGPHGRGAAAGRALPHGRRGQDPAEAPGAWTWSRPSSAWRRTSSTAPASPPASSSSARARSRRPRRRRS